MPALEGYRATTESYRRYKREWMQKARLDPVVRERWNKQRRGKYSAERKAYFANLRARHFFVWRARLWTSRHDVVVTARELRALWKSQRGLCALSGRPLDRSAHLDHIVAISKGGTHGLDNIRWTWAEVNGAKGTLSDEEFSVLCNQVIEWPGRRLLKEAT
jgi:5-methylcytosine-specific restriction endonuclease McrA